MDRYKDFNPDKGSNKEDGQRIPPVLADEIVADGLSFIGRNKQEYKLTIMKGGRFRISYPETSFMLKVGAYDENDLVVKMGGEPSFYSWLKIMLQKYKSA